MTPEQQLTRLTKLYPDLTQQVEQFVLSRGDKDFTDWPAWCFLPVAGWLAISQSRLASSEVEIGRLIADLAAIGTWRYSQGVYRFDDNLFDALMETEHNGAIPADVLKQLPEWSPYIEVNQGVTVDSEVVLGFWVHLEYDVNTQQEELRFVFNMESGLTVPAILHLGYKTLDEAMSSFLRATMKNVPDDLKPEPGTIEFLKKMQQKQQNLIKRVLPLVLYLISEKPDEIEPEKGLNYPSFKKTKKGLRLFPANKIRYQNIGKTIGEKLAKERNVAMSTAKSRSPHLRRGHWHGFWYGKGRTKYKIRWVMPTFVSSE